MQIGYQISSIDELLEWLPLILPIVLLHLILAIVALIDLYRSNRPTETKILWTAIIVFLSILGPIIYFVIGRRNQA